MQESVNWTFSEENKFQIKNNKEHNPFKTPWQFVLAAGCCGFSPKAFDANEIKFKVTEVREADDATDGELADTIFAVLEKLEHYQVEFRN